MSGSGILQGGAAIVTGGSSGIGLGLAILLAREGAGVTLIGRNEQRLARAAQTVAAVGVSIQVVAADVGSPGEMEKVVEVHSSHFGRLDVLVNSAGVCVPSRPAKQTPDQISATLSVDLGSVMFSYWAAIDLLIATATDHGLARVINLASITGRAPQPWPAVYSAAKAAVLNYTASMNQAYAARGVVSTAICPGFVKTPMSDGARGQDPAQMITVEDVAEVVRSLLRLSVNTYVPEIVLARSYSDDPSGL